MVNCKAEHSQNGNLILECPFDRVPNELLDTMFSHMEQRSLVNLRSVSKRFKHSAEVNLMGNFYLHLTIGLT